METYFLTVRLTNTKPTDRIDGKFQDVRGITIRANDEAQARRIWLQNAPGAEIHNCVNSRHIGRSGAKIKAKEDKVKTVAISAHLTQLRNL